MEIQTQEQIQKKLRKAFLVVMESADEKGILAKAEARLTKMTEIIAIKKRREEEIKSLLTENQSKIKKADPDAISPLSKQRTELARELAEINEELSDLSKTMLPECEKEKLEAQKALDQKVSNVILCMKRAFNQEILEVVQTLIEPRIKAWEEGFAELSSGYRVLLGSFPDLRFIEIVSPLLFDVTSGGKNDPTPPRIRRH